MVRKEAATTVRAVVRACSGREAVVEVEQGGCGRCHEEGGCGGQHLTQMFCAGARTYRVDNPDGLPVGAPVTVAIAAGAVRHSANLAYGLPVLGLILGAAAGMRLGGDSGAMLGALAGLLAAWAFARLKLRSRAGSLDVRPYIVSRFPASH